MTFEPALFAIETNPVVEFDPFEAAYIVTVALSRCPATLHLCSMDAMLSQFTYRSRVVSEFEFAIVVASLDGSEPDFATQDRSMAAPYIPPAVRPLVMPSVCHALRALVYVKRPRSIYRVTKETGACGKGLIKHGLLTRQLIELGYSLAETGTDPMGRTFWLMER